MDEQELHYEECRKYRASWIFPIIFNAPTPIVACNCDEVKEFYSKEELL